MLKVVQQLATGVVQCHWQNQRSTGPISLATDKQAACKLSIGRTKVYELLSKGLLRSVRIDRSRRIPVAALVDYVKRLEEESPADCR
jgi:excisionase family DNA binding protein